MDNFDRNERKAVKQFLDINQVNDENYKIIINNKQLNWKDVMEIFTIGKHKYNTHLNDQTGAWWSDAMLSNS